MKINQKRLLIIGLILVGFLILIISLVRVSLEAFAQEEIVGENLEREKIEINYHFPYPGILPDSPFYFLKEWRDKLWLFLTVNPKQKTNLLLLIANKKAYSAIMLKEKNKEKLGEKVLKDSQRYLEQAFKTSQEVQDGKDSQQAVIKAAEAHQSVVLKYNFAVDSSIYQKIIHP